MSLMITIKRTFFWRYLRNLKYKFKKIIKVAKNRKLLKFDGKNLTQDMQKEMQAIMKNNKNIYLHDEATAKSIAKNWDVIIATPSNIRFISNAIPIVLSANNNYAPYVAVMLQSILDTSNPKRIYHFLIFEYDFSDTTKKELLYQVSKFPHCSIDFVNTKISLDTIPIFSKAHLSLDTFSRLFIPYWLDGYQKVIYCDSDMLARQDLADLYDIDISDYSVGATANKIITRILSNKNYSSFSPRIYASFSLLEDWSRYIQAGVLLFNTKKFKEKKSLQDTIRFSIYYTNRFKQRYNDQDILSLLLDGDCLILPNEWNYCWSSSKRSLIPIHEIEPTVKIIHYTTKTKPWMDFFNIENNADALEYRNYAKNVPLYNSRNQQH